MRRPTLYSYKGLTMSLEDWASKIGMSKAALRQRLWTGWDFGKAVTTPHMRRRYEFNGELYTLGEVAAMKTDLSKEGMKSRLEIMSVKEAISKPRNGHKCSSSSCNLNCFECPYDDCIANK